jgi:CheY-like chemotaxis protein
VSKERENTTVKQAPEVLLVDDNPADVYLASQALAEGPHPCHVSHVRDGEQALAFLRHEGPYAGTTQPDLVILDLSMPKKSGESVLLAVRSDPNLNKIPVVVFSRSRSNRDIVRSYELGANCYLSKPASLQEFFSTVQLIGEFFDCRQPAPRGERWNNQRTYC